MLLFCPCVRFPAREEDGVHVGRGAMGRCVHVAAPLCEGT